MTGFGKGGRGQIIWRTVDFALGALAEDGLASATLLGIDEDFRILKAELFVEAIDIVEADLSNFLLFGLACGELTPAEILETVLSVARDRNDNLELERSHRPVWPIGILHPVDPAIVSMHLGADGAHTWTPRWTFSNDDGLAMWVFNYGVGPLTSGALLKCVAKIYGVWVT